MKVSSFKPGIISVIIVFACQREAAHIAVAKILCLCSPEINPEYATAAMTDTASLINLVPANGYSFLISKSYDLNGQDYTYWGHGACNGYVSPQVCRDCLVELKNNLNFCTGSMGGEAKETSCRLRFETHEFDLDW